MKLEKEVYINNVKGIHNKDTNRIFTTSDIVFCDLLTEEEISELSKLSNKLKLTLKVQEPILDEKERKYLSGVIRPFRNEIKYICKCSNYDGEEKEYISIYFKDNDEMSFKSFKKGTMYKNLELEKGYTLEELGL